MNRRSLISLVVCATFTLAITGVMAARKTLPRAVKAPSAASTAQTPPAPTGTPPALDTQDLQTFFAGLVPYMLKRNDIAGGVVAVVKNGKLIFAQGYGYANVAERKPVIADQTLFRIGSVSKLFTWTAVLQLAAAGKIDLDADINKYLDFKIPPKYGKPITMRDLMTMTPGFAETIDDLMAPSPKQLVPLREYLVRHIPPRIFPPGKVVAYSNYGATLAGYIVQRVSGESFDDYVEQHILMPLHMANSTFAQPLPDAMQPNLATGYITASGKTIVPFESVQAWPAGSFTSTATDMANFMLMQLQNGQFDGASVLPAATVQLMQSHHYSAAPDMNGYDFGFYQENRNGLTIIGHAGDTDAFHSDLHLLPGKNIGIFMSFNSAGKAPNGTAESVRTSLFYAFLDRYFPYTPPAISAIATAKADAARVAGWYWASRRENNSGLKLAYLLTQAQVAALPDGDITVNMLKDPSGAIKHWREIGPLTYREVNGQSRLRFVANDDGSIRWWITDDFPPVELFQPVRGLLAFGTFSRLTPIAIAVLVLTLLVWIGGAITRRHFKHKLVFAPYQFALRLAARIGVVLQLLVVIGWVGVFSWFSQPLSLFHTSVLASWMLVLYALGVLAIIGGIAIILDAIWRIRRGPGAWLARASEALLGLCAIYGIWAIIACGLVSFNMNF